MNNDNNIIPKYRFTEFKDDGSWDNLKVEEIITNESSSLSINKLEILDSGYKLFGADGLVGYIDSYKQEEDYIAIVKDGSGAGRLSYYPSYSSVVGTLTYLKIKDKKLNDLKFQYYNLHNIDFKNHIKGGGIPHIYYSDYKNDFIGNPPSITEQQKIAACLSSLDDVIAGHEEKLTVLEEHKKGLMQNLFPQEGETQPKYRFPEFANDGDWVEKTIIDTADKNIKWSFTGGPFGSNLKSSDYTSKGIRIIQLQNIGDGIFNDEYKIFTSLDKADELLSCNIYSGDIILSKMGDPVGRACIIPGDNERYLMASDGIRLAVNEKEFSKYFIFSLINSDTIRTKIEAKSTGSTRKRIGLDVLKQIPLLIPKTLNEQQKIASVLSSVDELIVAQREKIEALKKHKKGLMQGLFPKIES